MFTCSLSSNVSIRYWCWYVIHQILFLCLSLATLAGGCMVFLGCPFVCPCICLSVCHSVHSFVHVSVCLSVCLSQCSLRLSMHLCVCPFVCLLPNLLNTVFWKRLNQYWCLLAQVVHGARAWDGKLWGSRGQRTRSHEDEYGIHLEAWRRHQFLPL